MKAFYYILLVLMLPNAALAIKEYRPFHAPQINLCPGGILYPRFTQAAWINPAALSSTWTETVYQATLGYPTTGKDPYYGSGAAALSNFNFGFGAGYIGRSYKTSTHHSGFAGVGIGLGRFGFGVGGYRTDLSRTDYRLNVGMTFSSIRPNIDYGIVVYDAQSSSPTLVGGVGTGRNKPYRLEINFHVPLDLGASTLFRTLVSGSVNYGRASLTGSGTVSYSRSNVSSLSYVAAFGYWVSNSVHFSAQYNSSNNSYYLTFAFGNEFPERHEHDNRHHEHLLNWD